MNPERLQSKRVNSHCDSVHHKCLQRWTLDGRAWIRSAAPRFSACRDFPRPQRIRQHCFLHLYLQLISGLSSRMSSQTLMPTTSSRCVPAWFSSLGQVNIFSRWPEEEERQWPGNLDRYCDSIWGKRPQTSEAWLRASSCEAHRGFLR